MEKLINMSPNEIGILQKKADELWIIYPILGIALLAFSILMYYLGQKGAKLGFFVLSLAFVLSFALYFTNIQKQKFLADIKNAKKSQVIDKIEKKQIKNRKNETVKYYFVLYGKQYLVGDNFAKYKIHDVVQIEYASISEFLFSIQLIEDSRKSEDNSKIEHI